MFFLCKIILDGNRITYLLYYVIHIKHWECMELYAVFFYDYVSIHETYVQCILYDKLIYKVGRVKWQNNKKWYAFDYKRIQFLTLEGMYSIKFGKP